MMPFWLIYFRVPLDMEHHTSALNKTVLFSGVVHLFVHLMTHDLRKFISERIMPFRIVYFPDDEVPENLGL